MANTVDKISDGLKKLLGKTNDALNLGKIQLDINDLNNKISSGHKALGKYVEDLARNGETEMSLKDAYVLGYLEQIGENRAKLESLKERFEKQKKGLGV
jgi:hypothetical protein